MTTGNKSLEELGLQFFDQIVKKSEWRELQRHKRALIDVISVVESLDGYEDHYYRMEGLLNFLDTIQDLVADNTEVPEEVVFDR